MIIPSLFGPYLHDGSSDCAQIFLCNGCVLNVGLFASARRKCFLRYVIEFVNTVYALHGCNTCWIHSLGTQSALVMVWDVLMHVCETIHPHIIEAQYPHACS